MSLQRVLLLRADGTCGSLPRFHFQRGETKEFLYEHAITIRRFSRYADG